MAGRRLPLANVPNAVNSPFRNVAATSGKRTRVQAGDAIPGQPPAKKQVIAALDNEENVDPRRRNGVPVVAHDRHDEPFSKRSNAQPTAFERKLASARDGRHAPSRPQKAVSNNMETIREWQRHYRRLFPSYVIYLEGVPDDVRAKAVRQIQSLGAREEKFFSKHVTHVVTTRTIPPELITTSPDEDAGFEQKPAQPTALTQDTRRSTSILDANLQRRAQTQMAAQSVDILSRARGLGIKIWALEKLQRMLKTILETNMSEQVPPHNNLNRAVAIGRPQPRLAKDADLEQLLRNEKINGPADRDMTVTTQDMSAFRGCYIYIHDMDEKTKPVMVRDCPKPTSKDPGKWPQFFLTPAGRCPFVEDPNHTKQLNGNQVIAKAQEDIAAQRKTRAATALDAVPSRMNANLRRSPRKLALEASKPLDPPRAIPAKRQSSVDGVPLYGSAQQSLRGLPRMIGGEPIASGVQPSNVTSAIRSQVISSAAISSTAPGANRRVDSKEVLALKRKVFNVPSNHSIPSSYMNDVRAAINQDREPPPRAAKLRAQETLGVLLEDDESGGMKHRKPAPKRKKPVTRDPKPGYCENCRDKFEDFDEHCQSRTHRKFANTQENWSELDDLLRVLKRPRRVVES